MKRLLRIITLSLALITFMTSSGATLFNFCCDGCYGQFTAKNEMNCEHGDETQHACCDKESDDEDCHMKHTPKDECCYFKRHSIDIDSARLNLQLSVPFIWVSNNPITELYSFVSDTVEEVYKYFTPPPNLSPRTYLALIRVLII